jgi:hypothetical protein
MIAIKPYYYAITLTVHRTVLVLSRTQAQIAQTKLRSSRMTQNA